MDAAPRLLQQQAEYRHRFNRLPHPQLDSAIADTFARAASPSSPSFSSPRTSSRVVCKSITVIMFRHRYVICSPHIRSRVLFTLLRSRAGVVVSIVSGS
jgi:hypothetical protein